jgi:hypothetical protein
VIRPTQLVYLMLTSVLLSACGEGTVTSGDQVGGETYFALGDGALLLPDGALRPEDGDTKIPGNDIIFAEVPWNPELPGAEVPGSSGTLGDPCEGNKAC